VSTPLPVYLTPAQVADMLVVHERTILRWAAQDASMPVARLGRVIRFERSALLRWLSHKQPRRARPSAQASAQGGPNAV
jgi:excisionase family DNA binding protein